MKRINRIPVVSIVGRPNVGKSTLFNRLIGRQDAIVHGTPGVTRDRHYEMTDWNGKQFIVIDTGGYMPEASDEINVAIREQAQFAIEESDLVILLVDAVSGLTTTELQISDNIKRAKKRHLLCVNKADNVKIDQDVAANRDLYKLGLGKPKSISALNSRNIGDLLDDILTELGESFRDNVEDIQYEKNIIKLAIIGKPNVGKSSFVNAVTGKNKHIVSDMPGTTRDSIDTDFEYKGIHYKLIDTAGLRKKAKVKENLEFYSTLRTIKTIQECDVAVLLIDSIEGLAMQDIHVLEEARQLKKGLIIAINKWDLVDKSSTTYLDFERHLTRSLGSTGYVPYVFISSTEKQRVWKVLELAHKVFEERNKTISTSSLNAFLEKAIAKNHPPAVQGKDLRINYATQIKARPPVFAFFSNAPELIPSNYRQYLEKQMREQFGFEGVPLSLTFRKKSKDRY